jgi:hypothetical protein
MLYPWHDWLAMTRHDRAWHDEDMAEELGEYREAKGLFTKWSEVSDVVYTYGRSRWDRLDDFTFPLGKFAHVAGLIYMYPKYTLRFWFFRRAGRKVNATAQLHEVRNPRKTHKLHYIAEKYDLDKDAFQKVCERQLKYWPLLP